MSAPVPPEGSSPFGNGDFNPYQASVASDTAFGSNPATTARPLPVFVTVIMVISIIFCIFRAGIATVSVVFWLVMDRPSNPLFGMNLLLSAVIVPSGIVANSLILFKRSSGLQLAYVHVFAVVLSIGVAVVELATNWSTVAGSFGGGIETQIGYAVGGAFSLIIRLSIVAVYVAALMRFRQWLAGR